VAATKAATLLSAEALLAAEDLGEETISVPQWGGAVRVRGLSLGQYREAQRRSIVRGEVDEERLTIEIIHAGLVEPQLTQEQAASLTSKSAPALGIVSEAIARLSGFDADAEASATQAFPD
jgi:hypothetical protein